MIIYVNENSIKTHVLLDSYGDATLIRTEIAAKLKLKSPTRMLKYGTFHGYDPEFLSRLFSCHVKSVDESFHVKICNPSTVPKLSIKKRSGGRQSLQLR